MQKWPSDVLGHDLFLAHSNAYVLPIAERICRGCSD